MRKNFSPHTRQQDERFITRGQSQFEAGGFKDVPASTIPENGFVRAKNLINFGRYLEGRAGTRELSATELPGSGQINSIEFHDKTNQIVLHRGSAIYIADNLATTWTQATRIGPKEVCIYKSHMEQYKNFMYLFCSNGIFRIKVSESPVVYYRVNTEVPTSLIDDSGSNLYEYRMLYTMSRLTGVGLRNRYSDGVVIEQETGSTKYNTTSDRDYGIVTSSSAISSGAPLGVSGFEVPEDVITEEKHSQHTHYSLYRTLDIGTSGTNPTTNLTNNKELYVWVNDIPVAKAFEVSVNGTTCTAIKGEFEQGDVGSSINCYNGASFVSGTIASYTSSTTVELEAGFASGGVSNQPAGIGGGTVFTAYQSGVNLTVSPTGLVSSGNIGETIYWSDGVQAVITGFVSGDTVEVDSSDNRVDMYGTFGPTGRNFNTIVDDTVLRNRIRDNSLTSRFWTHIPPCDTGRIANGFMFAAQRNRSDLYYCQLIKDYNIGYHNAFYQTEVEEDNIKHLTILANDLIVYRAHSTSMFPISVYSDVIIEETGEVVSVLTNRVNIDSDRGLLDWGSVQNVGKDRQLLICDDYSLRLFDGRNYSDNLIRNKLMDEMKTLYPAYSSSYDEVNGYMWWGNL